MRKLWLWFTLSFLSALAHAQGVYQMWGMTQAGGIDNYGVIFNTDSAGNNLNVRHQFSLINQGVTPEQTELIEYNGKFYGVTYAGGVNNEGVIFEWDPVTNIYSKRFDFGSTNGKFPYGTLTLFGGKFYGLTYMGGNNNLGVIFEWDPVTNVYTKEFEFDVITNGYYPQGSLMLAGGKLYGMTWGGGAGAGVIFEWEPAGNIYTIKKNFDVTNGARPLGDLSLYAGKLYGMTRDGGSNGYGVIFELDPGTSVYTKKIDLTIAGGRMPTAKLTLSGGKFYGMTPRGGNADQGVIFEWDPASNVYTVKYHISGGLNGGTPKGSLATHGGKLYGLMSQGGVHSAGILFEFDPAASTFTKKLDFNGPIDGGFPKGTMTLTGNKFYGLTSSGGTIGLGVVFEWDPGTNSYTKKIELNSNNGYFPAGRVTSLNGKFYGMTQWGGENNGGTIFEIEPSGNVYSKKTDLNTAGGINPNGSMTLLNGRFYGVTEKGGINNAGVIFEWDPAANVYTKKFELSVSGGSNPKGSLIYGNGKFYGMTRAGGSNNAGVIFEWDPGTNIYTKKIDLNASVGSNPTGSLIFNGGKLYGVTSTGGNNNAGVIFEWDPGTNIYSKRIDFVVADGSNPYGDLCYYNGKFYGMAQMGGNNNLGVIFEWDAANNIYTKKIDLNTAAGCKPFGSLLLKSDKFYGVTNSGGISDYGVVFEWDPATNVYTKKADLTATNGRRPSYGNDLVLVPAPVSQGNQVSCQMLPAVTIDANNNYKWVPITDSLGNVTAEIFANGNTLGVVHTSLYTKTGPCREDGNFRLYLNRNITITPEIQPVNGAVSIRFFILKSELDSLKTAVNSQNQPSGVASINEVDVFKNDDNCSILGVNPALRLSATNGNYYSDYFLQSEVSSFSSFYFANKQLTVILPIKVTSFSGRKAGGTNLLKWEAACNSPVQFIIERGNDGVNFQQIGNVWANACNSPFYFTDSNPFIKNNYYRLGIIDNSGMINYSSTILLDAAAARSMLISIQPNPVTGKFITSELRVDKEGEIEFVVTDAWGRKVLDKRVVILAGISTISIPAPPAAGMYWLHAVGKNEKSNTVSFLKR